MGPSLKTIAFAGVITQNEEMVTLTLAEQLLLLALDDESGKLRPLPEQALDYALAGAILADLTRIGRIQVTLEKVAILDDSPVSSDPEDIGLLELIQADVQSLRGALTFLAGDAHGLRKRLIEHLVDKGVLKEVDKEFLWVFHFSRYPLADATAEGAVRQRLRNRIRMMDLPVSETDHVLISLVHVCQMEDLLLSEEEQDKYRERMDDICRHDKIGKAVLECLEEIQKALLEIRTYSGM